MYTIAQPQLVEKMVTVQRAVPTVEVVNLTQPEIRNENISVQVLLAVGLEGRG